MDEEILWQNGYHGLSRVKNLDRESIQGPIPDDHNHHFVQERDGWWTCLHCPERRQPNGRYK